MKTWHWKLAIPVLAGLLALPAAIPSADAQTPKKGGILKFVVPAEPPSFDGHRETTFALIHPIAPFYSTLIRVEPENPNSGKYVCDLCTEMPEPADGGTSYAFKIRKDAKFTDGTPVTAADVHATFQRIIFPPQGVSSARHAQFTMVDSVTNPDADTVVFKLKHPSGAFIPALATPYNFVYSKAKLDADQHWYENNVLGSGPFIFEERQAGAFIKGKRNPNYYHKGKPYLDGFEAIFAKTQTLRVQAIRGDQAAIEFRGFPPKSRDDLVKALGKDITVQESDWNCVLLTTPNQEEKPFDDARVRKALALAVDRWSGSKDLSKIAIVKSVGGIVFPGHPLAAKKAELEQIIGYWPDINKSRAEAKKLLKEAGQENLKFTLLNRGVDQPYTIVGTWLIDQWKQVGVTVDQKVEVDGPVLRVSARRQVRGGAGVQLPVGRQPAGRRLPVPARFRRPVWQVQGRRADQAARRHEQDGRRGRAEEDHAGVREARAERSRLQRHYAVVVPHHPAPVLREGMDGHAQPLPEPGPVAGLAG